MKKKKILMIGLLVIVLATLVGFIIMINNKSVEMANNNSNKETVASNDKKNAGQVVEITDNYFIEQTNDIYFNTEDYVNKTIKMEGLVYSYDDVVTGNTYYAVVRNTPGCCGADGLAGLDIRYDGEYPAVNTWVKVEGTLEKEDFDGSEIPVIKVSSLTESEEGTTFVTN